MSSRAARSDKDGLCEILNEAISDGDWERFVWILTEEMRHSNPACLIHGGSARSRMLEKLSVGDNADFSLVMDAIYCAGIKLVVEPRI